MRTLLLDAVAAGGQAAASSRIENYLGFTSGISGAELTGRAAVQAQKFGARIASPSQAARLDTTHERLRIMLTDHTTIEARAVVIATGARYRSLPLDRWAEFEGVMPADPVGHGGCRLCRLAGHRIGQYAIGQYAHFQQCARLVILALILGRERL
jgi:glycine/D-amino acid oxidase-like deaminating enzyme